MQQVPYKSCNEIFLANKTCILKVAGFTVGFDKVFFYYSFNALIQFALPVLAGETSTPLTVCPSYHHPLPAKHCTNENSEPATLELTATGASALETTFHAGAFSNFSITEN